MNGNTRKSRKGYTLIDVLVGMVILAISLAAIFSLTITTSRLMERNQFTAAAASLAEAKFEELRNTDYDSITSGSEYGLNSRGEVVTEGDFDRGWVSAEDESGGAPLDDTKLVTVTVTWDQWGETRTYTLTGVIAR